jgi:hypothetical protein
MRVVGVFGGYSDGPALAGIGTGKVRNAGIDGEVIALLLAVPLPATSARSFDW